VSGVSGADAPGVADAHSGTKYRTIVADPPWPFQWQGGTGGRRRNKTTLGYDTMPIAEIAALRPDAAPDATLFMWVTQDALHNGTIAGGDDISKMR